MAWREDGRMAFDYAASLELKETPWVTLPKEKFDLFAKESLVDCSESGLLEVEGKYIWDKGNSPCRWRSADEMPELASRLDVRLTAQKVFDGNLGASNKTINMKWLLKFELNRVD